MNPIDIAIICVIALIIGAAVAYIIKAKKSGKKCIGCPDSASCSHCSGACSSCSSASSCAHKADEGKESPCSCGCGNKK